MDKKLANRETLSHFSAILITLLMALGMSSYYKFYPSHGYVDRGHYVLFVILSVTFFTTAAPFLRYRRKPTDLTLLLPLGLVFAAISYLWSVPGVGHPGLPLSLSVLSLIMFGLYFIEQQSLENLLQYLVLYRVAICAVLGLGVLLLFAREGFTAFHDGRGALFGGPNVFIRFMFLLTCFVWVYFSGARRAGLLLGCAFATLLSGSKGGVLVLLLFIGYFVVRRIGVVITLMLSAIIISALLAFLDQLPSTIQRALFVADILSAQSGEGLGSSTSIRVKSVFLSWRLFTEHPFFGIGIGSYAHWSGPNVPYPHNFLLETLTYGLMVAAPIWMGICACIIKARIWKPRDVKWQEVLRIYSLFAVVFTLISGDILNSKDWYFFLFLLSLVPEKFKASPLTLPHFGTSENKYSTHPPATRG